MSGQTFRGFDQLGKNLGIPSRQDSRTSYGPSEPGRSDEKKQKPNFLLETSDYVSIAEQNIKSLRRPERYDPKKLTFGNLTTSKIRNILTLVNQIYNQVVLCSGDLPQTIVNDIRYMKIRLVYEAGREKDVMQFCKKTEIIDALDFIGNSRQTFLRYAKYLEALVAYHRFYGGKD